MATIEKRKNRNGQTTYRAKIRLRGYPSQSATFLRLSDAKKWIQSVESAMREGRYFKIRESKKHSLSDLVDRYKKEVFPNKPKSQACQRTQLNWWRNELGDYLLSDVTPALLNEYRGKLINEKSLRGDKKRSNATINRYCAILSHAFTVAVKEWGWMQENPMLKITKLKEPRGRIRYLSNEERKRFLKECEKSSNPYLYTLVIWALTTGARKMEILGLKWKNVDLDRGLIFLYDTKNGERRSLPLVDKAKDLALELYEKRSINTDLVFPAKNLIKPVDIRRPFETALKKAQIENFRWHDLRHSCASYLAMNGASLAEIASILGHKTLSMVKRYAHLSDSHNANVIASMASNMIYNENDKEE